MIQEILANWNQLCELYAEEMQIQRQIQMIEESLRSLAPVEIDWLIDRPSNREIIEACKKAISSHLGDGSDQMHYAVAQWIDPQSVQVNLSIQSVPAGKIICQRKIPFLPGEIWREISVVEPNVSLIESKVESTQTILLLADKETQRAVEMANFQARARELARVCRALWNLGLVDQTQFKVTLCCYYAAKGGHEFQTNVRAARRYFLEFLRLLYREGTAEHLKAMKPLDFPVLARLFATYLLRDQQSPIPKSELPLHLSDLNPKYPMLWRAGQLAREDRVQFCRALFEIYQVDPDFAITTLNELRRLKDQTSFRDLTLDPSSMDLPKVLVRLALSYPPKVAREFLNFCLAVLDVSGIGQQAEAGLLQALVASTRFSNLEVATTLDLTTKTTLYSDADRKIREAKNLVDGLAHTSRTNPNLRGRVGRLSRLLNELAGQVERAHRHIFRSAQLNIDVNTFTLPQRVWSPVELRISNTDFGVARDISVNFSPSSDYEARNLSLQIPPVFGKNSVVTSMDVKPVTTSVFELLGKMKYSDESASGKTVILRHVINVSNPAAFRAFHSPYITGDPVRDSRMFFGRRQELAEILQTLIGQYQDRITVIHGRRRTGKTSILFQLKEGDPNVLSVENLVEFSKRYIRIYITFERFGVSSHVFEIYYHIFSSISLELKAFGLVIPKYQISDFRDLPADALLDSFLNEVDELLMKADKRALLMFDEFDTLIRNKGEDTGLFGFIREIIIKHGSHVSFIFAGTNEMIGMMQSKTRRLYQMTGIPIEVMSLSPEEARELVVQPIKALNPDFEWDPPAIDYIVSITGCNPYYVQTICDRVVNDLISGRRLRATYTDVDRVISRVAEALGDLDDTVENLDSIEEKTVLTCLANLAGSPGDEQIWQSTVVIEQKIRERSQRFTISQVAQALRSLCAKYILEQQETDQDEMGYRYRVPLLQIRIRNTLKLDDVLREGGYT